MPLGGLQRGQQIAERPLELLLQRLPHHLAVRVERGLARQEHHPAPGGDHGVREAGGRRQPGRVHPLDAHTGRPSPADPRAPASRVPASRVLASRADASLAYNSLAMTVRCTSLAPS